MNGLPYYKAYPRDFIEGTIGMGFELKGAYRIVLDLIYMQGGRLPDDARYISGMLGCSVKKWNGFRESLLSLGKIKVSGEFLINDRAVIEIETIGKLQDKQRENRSRPNKNNELQSPRFDHTEPEPEPDIGGGSARDAYEPTAREQILGAMGLGPDGIIGAGKFVGGQGDVAEMDRWLALPGLTLPIICDEIRRIVSVKPDGPPSSFRYFTAAMQRLSGQVTAPPLRPVDSPHPRQFPAVSPQFPRVRGRTKSEIENAKH